MWEKVGEAEVEVRVRPWKSAELREYLKREYGAGTEPDAYLLEAGLGASSPWTRVQRALKRAVRAVGKAMGAEAHPDEGNPE